MQLIFMVHSSNSECNADCDYAVVDLTAATAELIRRRAACAHLAAKEDRHLQEIGYWDGMAEFYNTALVDACQDALAAAASDEDANDAATAWLDELESQGYAVVPQGVELSLLEPQRTECDRMILSVSSGDHDCDIRWKSIPKHADIYVTTWDLPLSALESLASAPAARENPQPATGLAEPEIYLPCFGITIRLDRKPSSEGPASGTITSELKQDATADDAEYFACIDGLESLILAHACAGIDVASPAYVEGIETAVSAIANNL